jgi:hypothetical protein
VKARRKAIREKLKNHPTPEELLASGEDSESIPQGVVLDAMALLGHLRVACEAARCSLTKLAERSGLDKPARS